MKQDQVQAENQYENDETNAELYVSKEPNLQINNKIFNQYLEAVFSIRPDLQKMYSQYQTLDLFSNTKSHVRENKNPIIRARKKELLLVMQKIVTKLLGSKIAESVVKQLKGNDSVSTAQHTASLGHYVLKLTLQNALPYFNTDHPNLQNVIVLACANVSFNNSSTPRSKLFHTKSGLDYLPFFGRSVDSSTVIYHPSYDWKSCEVMSREIQNIERGGNLTKIQAQNLREALDEIFSAPHALSVQNFTDQVTITNFYLFKKIFSNYSKKVPNLIYLSQEDVVINLILDFHIQNKSTIHSILFETKMHKILEKNFNNVSGAFSLKSKSGTFLFWGYDHETLRRFQLFREGGHLVSLDKTFKLPLNAESIRQALVDRKLIPSVMLTFSVLSFYYGLFLTGAYKQTHDLPRLLARYRKSVKEYGDKEALDATEGLITNNLIVPASILYMHTKEGGFVPSTALDILINKDNLGSWEEIFSAFSKIPMSEIVVKMFPILYNRLCPPKSKLPELAAITEQDLDKFTAFPHKVHPIVRQLTS